METRFGTETKRYALLGALFGFCFPVGATAILIFQNDLSWSLSSITFLQRTTPLLWIIDSAPFFLGLFASFAGVRQDRLIGVLAAREEVIKERTRELALANKAVKELLDNMQQAIFTVGNDGRVNPEFSAHTGTLFGDVPIAGESILELLQLRMDTPSEASLRMKNWFDLIIGSDELQWMMTQDEAIRSLDYQRPTSEGGSEKRALELEYAPIYLDGAISKVMVIAKDVTTLRHLQRDVSRKEQELGLITEVVSAGEATFREFMSEAKDLIEGLQNGAPAAGSEEKPRPTAQDVLRCVHTVKGNARMCGLRIIEMVAHEIEGSFSGTSSKGTVQTPRTRLPLGADPLGPLLDTLADAERLGNAVFGGTGTGRAPGGPNPAAIKQLERTYSRLVGYVRDGGLTADEGGRDILSGLGEAVAAVSEVALRTIEAPLQRLVDDLALVTKKRARLFFHGDLVTVSHVARSTLREILVHALRNAMDHGVEGPDERAAKGKEPEARLDLFFDTDGETVVVKVRDDGDGIPIDALKKKCVQRGVFSQPEADAMGVQQAIELVFYPGVSTTDTVTAISGRGAGMDIIRRAAERHGGEVSLRSEKGKYTELTIRVPRSICPPEPQEQRRKVPRRSVYYYLLIHDADGKELGRLIDASTKGLMAAHSTSIAVGETLQVSIVGPEELMDNRTVQTRIHCRWTQVATSGSGFVSGFTFDDMPANGRAILNEWVVALGIEGESLLYSE